MTHRNSLIGKLTHRNSVIGGVARETSNGVQRILKQSVSAVCGAFEKEVTVPVERVAQTKAKLRSKGFFIVGTSEPGGRTRKIWFIRGGLAGL